MHTEADNIRISILMSSYNGEKYIFEQLQSLKNQTVMVNELVIIDDHSSDNTVCIIKEFIADNNLQNSCRLIENDINHGWKANFKKGLQELSGDIIFFCDQDDIWRPDKIEESLKAFRNYPDTLVIGTSVRHFDDDGNTVYIEGSLDGMTERVKYKANGDGFKAHPPGCCMAVRREYIERIMQYYSESWAHDDFFFRFATIDEKCLLIHKELIDHRLSGTNVTSISIRKLADRMRQAENNVSNYGSLLKYCERLTMESKEKALHLSNLKDNMICVKYHYEGNVRRYRLLKDRDFKMLIPLVFRYPKIYKSVKQLMGDLLLLIKD